MKKFFLLATLVSVIVFLWLTKPNHLYKRATIKIGPNEIITDVADTETLREKGLGGREKLAENEGMLFLFPEKYYYSFWMKGMIIPIDVVWLSDNEIIDITENLLPPKSNNNYLPSFRPKAPVNKVLEVNAGYAKAKGLKIGERVVVENIP
ncbi:MAG: DUF192 domain-containing protein [Patescibacteria group bacterium]|nr:DUF192 domain-containing protein [Patescibacteria group bacterium]